MRVLFSHGLIAVSKPRCGSTSVREILDDLVDRSRGDIVVDLAEENPPFHPHLSAPRLKQVLVQKGYDISGMTTFIMTRNPVDMLWSYFHFFAPDERGFYNYDRGWNPAALMTFERWVMRGWIGMEIGSSTLAPEWISTKNLSPLNLEAHIETRDGRTEVDHVFLLEEIDKFAAWLANHTRREVAVRHVNASHHGALPKIGSGMRDRIVGMFPRESKIYAL
jgi:hypothetical protein